ncbi:V-set and immunoglobulin domain-containing protein 1-like isoform X3 [Toxotes jaculatrix]|uniref:V-set and immunoglobulin domain-containing protein 1-like isoform X3 n=1 Tax=Toxotes jaculatrix TaxID=941984 RepID=UPI001B3ADC14|nr:V-set and immunoglobulin domain-containing protein 1-like isoform X3 [Toxotes jaculatrix]
MELLPLVCLWVLTRSGTTFAAGDGPKIITVMEGSDVTLPCSLSTRQSIVGKRFEWKKDGQKEVFLYEGSPLSGQDPQFRRRVSHFEEELSHGDASITIRDTKVADTGNYTCELQSQTFHIELLVGSAPEPNIRILGETNGGTLLLCEVLGAFPKPSVQWTDRAGNILPAEEPQVSERRGRYDIILQTTVTKADNYRCVATQKEISHQIDSDTFVSVPETPTGWIYSTSALGTLLSGAVVGGDGPLKDRSDENIAGSAPEPNIRKLGETKDGTLLQCKVLGAFPKPSVQWKDRAGNILPAEEPQVSERGGRYDIILQTTVTKTNYYLCVATQEEISHQIYSEKFVSVHDGGLPGSKGENIKPHTGLILAAVLCFVAGVFTTV